MRSARRIRMPHLRWVDRQPGGIRFENRCDDGHSFARPVTVLRGHPMSIEFQLTWSFAFIAGGISTLYMVYQWVSSQREGR